MKVMKNAVEQKVFDLTTIEGANEAFDVLTPYALQQIEKETTYNLNRVEISYNNAKLLVQKLEEYGFVEGEHFTQNIYLMDTTYSTTIHTSDGKDYETIDVTIPWKRCIADVMLITLNDRAPSGNLEECLVTVRYEKNWKLGDTFECTPITKQYRFYKASGFLQQLLNHRETVTNRYEGKQRQLGIIAKGIEILSERFPNATVEVANYYRRNSYGSEKCIRVVFPSKSYVMVSAYFADNGEVRFSELERYDSYRETINQVMDRFNNQ